MQEFSVHVFVALLQSSFSLRFFFFQGAKGNPGVRGDEGGRGEKVLSYLRCLNSSIVRRFLPGK